MGSNIQVEVDEEEPIATITLSKPERRNAISDEDAMTLAERIEELDADDDVRCVIIQGEGDAFCAGADLAAGGMSSPTADSIDRGLHGVVRSIMRLSKPAIAKVRGPAVGAGASIATACDFVYTDDTAEIGFVFSNIGLTADSGATFILPRLVGVRTATDLLMSGRTLDAEEAEETGLTTEVVTEDLDERVRERAVTLANGPTRSFGAIRRLVLRSSHNTLEEQLEAEAHAQEIMFNTDDAMEGIGAFLEDRDPEFEGK